MVNRRLKGHPQNPKKEVKYKGSYSFSLKNRKKKLSKKKKNCVALKVTLLEKKYRLQFSKGLVTLKHVALSK